MVRWAAFQRDQHPVNLQSIRLSSAIYCLSVLSNFASSPCILQPAEEESAACSLIRVNMDILQFCAREFGQIKSNSYTVPMSESSSICIHRIPDRPAMGAET